jgi:hypothetical protein
MFGLFRFLLSVLASPFKSKSRLEAANSSHRWCGTIGESCPSERAKKIKDLRSKFRSVVSQKIDLGSGWEASKKFGNFVPKIRQFPCPGLSKNWTPALS